MAKKGGHWGDKGTKGDLSIYVSTRISKSPVLVRALPVLERVPVLVRAYARFSTGFAFSARLFWWPVPV